MPVSIVVVFFLILVLATVIVAREGFGGDQNADVPVGAIVKGGLAFVAAFSFLYMSAGHAAGVL